MTILRSLIGGESRSVEDATKPLTSASLTSVLGVDAATESGVHVTTEMAYRMTAVYRAVALLSGLIAGLPLHAYQRRPDGGRERVDVPLISKPHPEMTSLEVWERVAQSLLTSGDAFARKHRDRMRRVRWLEPLHPNSVRVELRKEWVREGNPLGKRIGVIDGARIEWLDPSDGGDALHIPGMSYDGVVGMSPIGMARQGIGLALSAERYAARMFDRGALIQGVLHTDQELSQDSAEDLKEQWRRKTAGAENQWSIPVLDSGAKFSPISLPPADAQYIEIRKFSIQEIARLYGIPPHLLADVERSTSWGTGIEQQNMQMLTFTLDPWLVRIEERINRHLLTQTRADYVKFNRAALLRADTANRFMAYQRAIQNSWMNADDIRELEDMDPLPDGQGQQFYRPANLTPVDQSEEIDDEA